MIGDFGMGKLLKGKIYSFFVLVALAAGSIIAKSILSAFAEENQKKVEDNGIQL